MERLRLGLYGGTFDPPHIGHLVLAAEAMDQLGLDRVLWILTPQPPHKPDQLITAVEIRLEMLREAIAAEPAFEISMVEVDRSPPYYAVETVQLLRQEYPNDILIYLMGGDSLRDLPTWHAPQEFVAACDRLGVMLRPGAKVDLPGLESTLPGVTDKVLFVSTPLLEISASDIRQRVASSRPFRYYLPDAVYGLIIEHCLYRNCE